MHYATIALETGKRSIVDVTGQVQDIVRSSGIRDGVCFVQSLHTTAGIYTNVTEDLQEDVLGILARLVPADSYNHNAYDPNAEAHIKKILTGRTATVIVENGRLVLGTWEKIQFAEFDGPRKRTVHVTVLGA